MTPSESARCSDRLCSRPIKARGLCSRHYSRANSDGTLADHPTKWDAAPNPLICVCPSPLADPRVDFGECKRCYRCPLSLFRILRVEVAA